MTDHEVAADALLTSIRDALDAYAIAAETRFGVEYARQHAENVIVAAFAKAVSQSVGGGPVTTWETTK